MLQFRTIYNRLHAISYYYCGYSSMVSLVKVAGYCRRSQGSPLTLSCSGQLHHRAQHPANWHCWYHTAATLASSAQRHAWLKQAMPPTFVTAAGHGIEVCTGNGNRWYCVKSTFINSVWKNCGFPLADFWKFWSIYVWNLVGVYSAYALRICCQLIQPEQCGVYASAR